MGRRLTFIQYLRVWIIQELARNTVSDVILVVLTTQVTDAAALTLDMVAQQEGVLPALETSHALAWAVDAASKMRPEKSL